MLLLTVVLLHAAGPASRAQSVKPTPAAQALAEGEQLWAEGRAEAQRKAIKKYEQARVLWHAAGAQAEEAHAWWLIGDAHQQLGATQTALTCYEQALRLSQAARDARREIEALNGLASVNILLGKYQPALELCDKALALSRREQYSRGEADALNNMGDAYSYRGQPRQALDYYKRALPLWQALGDRRGLAQTFLCLGYTQSDLSELKQAADFYQQALTLWQAARDVRGQALTLTAIAHIHNKLDDKQVALGLYNQARLLFQLIEDRLGEARILNGMGYIYTGLNKPKEAIEYYDQALQLCRSRSSQCELYNTIRLGQLYSSIGEPQRSIGYYQSALNLANTLSDQRSKAYVLRNIGTVREATGDIKAALDYYQQALALDRASDDRLGTALTLTNIGNAYATAGDVQQAVEHFTKALELNRAILSPTGELQTLYGLARVERGRGDLTAARAHIEEALKIGDTLRTKVAGQDMRASYSTTVHQQYEFYVDVLMRLHGQQPAGRFEVAAFEASERGRARSLIESLAEGRKDIRQGVDADLLRRERELQLQLNTQAEQQFRLARRKATPEEWAALERSLNALTREYQQVQGHIRASSPRYAALVQPAPLTLTEMQQQVLDADTVLLEYALGQERSFVWAVTPDTIKSFELPARAQVEQAARRVYELLTARNRQVPGETALQWQARVRQAETDYTTAAQTLARMLLGPVAGELGQKRIVVVADGALQYVPFAALPTTGDVPLIAEHEVVSLPSAAVLAVMRAELRGRTPAPKSVAVIADPVFDVDDERLAATKFARGGRRTDQTNGNANANATLTRRTARSSHASSRGRCAASTGPATICGSRACPSRNARPRRSWRPC